MSEIDPFKINLPLGEGKFAGCTRNGEEVSLWLEDPVQKIFSEDGA